MRKLITGNQLKIMVLDKVTDVQRKTGYNPHRDDVKIFIGRADWHEVMRSPEIYQLAPPCYQPDPSKPQTQFMGWNVFWLEHGQDPFVSVEIHNQIT